MSDSAPAPGAAAATPIAPDRVVYDLPSLACPRLSPDGTRIAYVRNQVNRESGKPEAHIWLVDVDVDADTDDGAHRRRLTWTGTRNGDPVWSPDGSKLAFTSLRDGDKPHTVVVLGFDGGEPEIVSRHATPPSGLAWSPDGTRLAYSAAVDPENPDETPRNPKAPAPVRVVKRIDYKQDGAGFVNDVRNQVFVVDVATGETRQLTTTAIDHLAPAWSPDGTTLALTLPRLNGMASQLGLLDVASGALTTYGADHGSAHLAAWSPDGTSILFAGNDHSTPHEELMLLDVASGTIRTITDDLAFLPDGGYQSGGPAGAPVWTNDTTVLVHGLHRGGSGIWSLDVPSGALTQRAWWPEMHSGFSVAANGSVIAQVVTSLDGVAGITRIDTATGEQTRLFNELDAFVAETPFASWELLTLEREGFTIEAWLLKPAGFDESKRYPVILDVHGGPHNAYGYGINGLAEVFATNGYLVILPNPRGSGTYGKAFAEAVIGDWGNEDWRDLEAMLDLVLERPYADPERTGIIGYSYGGYMVSWVLGHTGRFVTAICGAPVFDGESFFGTADIGHEFYHEMGSLPWDGSDNRLRDRSPSDHIHNATTPTLVVHGEADERCPIGQGEQLFMSLMKLGVETEFARYPGGSHLFINSGEPAHRADYNARCLAWFDRFLKS
ncbi:MAG: alpha/beta fold hydrolase [Thermomicrobiales bacterium]